MFDRFTLESLAVVFDPDPPTFRVFPCMLARAPAPHST